ncbi:MAG: hypothetical protein ACREGR_01460 [Minisyncoccia bacterium]
MKTLLYGILLIILVGIGGLIYRNAVSHPMAPAGACPLDAKLCPDGSAVGRVAPACNFAPCPPPNVSVAGIVFALPGGYASTTLPDDSSVAAFVSEGVTPSQIVIHSYALATSSAQDVIYATAVGDASGAPVSPSAFSATTIGTRTYTFVVLGRSEGVIHAAYYLPVGGSVLRFDAIDQAADWTNPNLDISVLPADSALRAMLTTLQTDQ